MALRKDVLELLRLYQGTNPREAFKPRLQPEDWRQREKDQLLFRSQVPDHLEPAYDIALADELLEQHILKPEEQLKWYQQLGTYDVPQDKPWPVMPSRSDALVFITVKGRAAIARHGTKSEILSARLKVDLARRTLTLDGVRHDVSSERALRWVKILANRPDKWISSKDLESLDSDLMTGRTDKLKKFLPDKVLVLIESKPGTGSRIRLDRN